MHFSKTYAQLLLSLPPELRDNAVQYRQLKKVINQIVDELDSLGLRPDVLQEYIDRTPSTSTASAVLEVPDVVVVESDGAEEGSDVISEYSASGRTTSDGAVSIDIPDSQRRRRHSWNGGDGSAKLSAGLSAPQTPSTASSMSSSSADLVRHHPHLSPSPGTKVVYELNEVGDRIEPQLRIWVPDDGIVNEVQTLQVPSRSWGHKRSSSQDSRDDASSFELELDEVDEEDVKAVLDEENTNEQTPRLLWSLQRDLGNNERPSIDELPDFTLPDAALPPPEPEPAETDSVQGPPTKELIIPLQSDLQFYTLLTSALESISLHLASVESSFVASIEALARTISDNSRPASASVGSTKFKAHSGISGDDAGAVRVSVRMGGMKSDLYAWREIFQLYVEAEVFESVSERNRGERGIEESEDRLKKFVERLAQRGLGSIGGGQGRFRMKASVQALETFLDMNLFILNVKKFSHANSEATRKILKKHAKRTALPLPSAASSSSLPLVHASSNTLASAFDQHPILMLLMNSSPNQGLGTPVSLPRLLVQAIGSTLIPVIPSIEDYSCLICTSLAFKPIRLGCGHLFCVRCLVKMQKRGKGRCPMCRSESVLIANRSNVDWALLNFMQDWFPQEAKDKLKSNEKEAAEEEMQELGIDPNQSCIVV